MSPREPNEIQQSPQQWQSQLYIISGGKLRGSRPASKDLGVLRDEKQDMSQQCVLAAQITNSILG